MKRGVTADINKTQFETIMKTCGSFFTAEQVADCLDIDRATLFRWIKKEYKETFATLRVRFSSKSKLQLNAYRWKAMANGNARLIERSMEEEGLWEKRDGSAQADPEDTAAGAWADVLGQIRSVMEADEDDPAS